MSSTLFWCLRQEKRPIYVEWLHKKKKKKKWAWNCNYSRMTFPPVSSCRFWSSLSWQPSLYQVTCGQRSHCLFISVSASVRAFVNLSTSNPASGQLLSPAGSMSAAWLWCQATIYSSVSADSPRCPHNVRQSIIMWPTYLPRLPTA